MSKAKSRESKEKEQTKLGKYIVLDNYPNVYS